MPHKRCSWRDSGETHGRKSSGVARVASTVAAPPAEVASVAQPTTGGNVAEDDSSTGRHRQRSPGFHLDCGAGPEVPHVGIVFVHGIGSQEAGATLLEWGGRIIGLLLDARAVQEAKGDPVIDCQLDPGPSESRFIELQLPTAKNKQGHVVPEQHWVMTEAWWARRVQPPSFGEMAEWLGPRGAVKRIVTAMLPRSRTEHDPRMRPAVSVQRLERKMNTSRLLWDVLRRRAPNGQPVVKENAAIGSIYGNAGPSPGPAVEAAGNVVSDIGTLLTKVGAGLYFQAISALVLVVYGALRSIEKVLPIGPLKNGALTRPIDRFLLEWFGDVYVLLRDPAQSASVRSRLIDALNDLHANDCTSVAIVAHSGGAIVSYMTLADEAKKGVKVDRLFTLGEGLNLAWRLTTGDDGVVDAETRRRYDRLYTDAFKDRDDLVWDDFWASQDPAPVGVLTPDGQTMNDASLGRIRTHAVWNRLAFREDHGTYWDNDEEFLIPMARLLDENPIGARMFADSDEDVRRSNRRRRRLSFLSLWRQLVLVAPTAAIMAVFAASSDYVSQVGSTVAQAWSKLPGNEIISNPVTSIRDLGLETSDVGRFLAETGVWVIAAVLGLLTLVALLAPPERPVPWYDKKKKPWRPFNLFALFLRFLPWVVAGPVVVIVIRAWFQFSSGATATGGEVGEAILRAFGVTLIVAVLASLMFGSPWKVGWAPSWLRDGVEMAVTIGVMAVVAVLAVSPFVAILAFEQVGTLVLGVATVIIAFQVIGRIGIWRWNVWDDRERVAARTQAPYPQLLRIFVQMTLLVVTVVIAFAAVVQGSSTLAIAAMGGVAIAVLLGVAVDVFDTARQERRSPLDAMLQGASHF
jgi:hypothetical protein